MLKYTKMLLNPISLSGTASSCIGRGRGQRIVGHKLPPCSLFYVTFWDVLLWLYPPLCSRAKTLGWLAV